MYDFEIRAVPKITRISEHPVVDFLGKPEGSPEIPSPNDELYMSYRYHMASRVDNQKSVQNWFIYLVAGTAILMALLVSMVFVVTAFVYRLSFGPVIDICYNPNYNESNETNQSHSLVGPKLPLAVAGACLTIGVIFDVQMFRFIKKKRKEIQPSVAMMTWKHSQPPMVSLSQKDTNASKATIPIQATALGVVNLGVIVLLFIMVQGFGLGKDSPYFIAVVGLLVLVTHMPLILLFTVKSHVKQQQQTNKKICPPSGLQFHGEQSVATMTIH